MSDKEEGYKGYTIKIYVDQDARDPRDDSEPLGKMLCVHNGRYGLGDTHEMTVENLERYAAREDVISLPLYLYDHGILAISTESFQGRAPHAEWDSGQVGWITITKEEICKEYGVKRISSKLKKKIEDGLRSEVEIYNHYLSGNVWGYEIEGPDGDWLDSCWGYYGDPEGFLLQEAQSFVDWHIKEAKEKNLRMQLAGLI
jgi:hypothetical protein